MNAPSTTGLDFDSGRALGALSIAAAALALFATFAFSLFFAGPAGAATAKPSVEGVWTSNVTATSADLNALINPQGETTAYHFEYGIGTSYGASIPTPDGEILAAATAQKVSVHLTGLNGGIRHFRLVATNSTGTTTTLDQTFSFYPPSCPNEHLRQQTGAAFLPDCRAYELVSPINSGNALLMPAGPISALAADPPRLAFSGIVSGIPGTGEPQSARSADLYVATRTTEGWSTRYVGIPGNKGSAVGGTPNEGPETSGVSLAGQGQPSGVRADASLNMLLDWDDGRQGVEGPEIGSFAPYVWDAEGNSLGRLPTTLNEVANGATDVSAGGFIGAVRLSADSNYYFFSSANVAFTPDGLTSGSGSVYANDIEADTTEKISVLNNGEDIPHEPGALTQDYLNIPAAATNGSRVVIEAPKQGVCGQGTCGPMPNVCSLNNDYYLQKCPSHLPSHLYVRNVADQITYDLSGSHATTLQGMTSDGTRVFFSSPGQMTGDDTDSSEDLFMWQEGATPEVVRISTGDGVTGDTDSCTASWIGGCGAEFVKTKAEQRGAFVTPVDQTYSDDPIASESGDAYFYSPELLDGGQGVAGERNLYVFRNGHTQYVSTLEGDASISRIQISPDGLHAAFLTFQRMTAYDNTSATGVCTPSPGPFSGIPQTGPRCLEVYVYEPSTSEIRCASCRPTGEPPAGDAEASQNGRFMTDDGRVFFGTPESLTPGDADGLHDTYEFVENRPQLISSGTEATDSNGYINTGLVGVSADGADVYFSTTSTLVGQDKNGQFLKFYDARTNGGFNYAPPAAPCAAADECHGPGASTSGAISSGTAAPLGNGGNATSINQKKGTKPKKHRRRHRHRHATRARHADRERGARG